MSAAAGISWWNFYFRLYPTTIQSPQVIDFLNYYVPRQPDRLTLARTPDRLKLAGKRPLEESKEHTEA
jgi:hypothetical protein